MHLALTWLLGMMATTAPSLQNTDTHTLDNGLKVTLIDAPGGERSAIVVLFDIGGDHDPPGKSGLTHLLEHLHVTAATEHQEARSAEKYMHQYPLGWNAQTGAQHTIFATVFPKDQIKTELRDAADRMRDLRITQADLDREIPRVIREVGSMFEFYPQLLAFNHGMELVRPSLHDGRRGGAPDEVRNLTLEELQAFHAAHYRPANARLIVATPDVERTRPMIDELFAGIEPGSRIDPPPPRPKPAGDREDLITIRTEYSPEYPYIAGVVMRAPEVDDDAYATFLVVAGRLFQSTLVTDAQPKPTVQYGLLDAPEALVITDMVRDGETLADARSRVDAVVHDALHDPVTPDDAASLEFSYGLMLGMMDVPPMMAKNNPYFAAFATGRQAQMGLEGDVLREQLRAVDDTELAALREWLETNQAMARMNVITGPNLQEQNRPSGP
ncbi:MAG: insulinase family protein [Phycisphaerales bacterium]|nr:insulinase family protein [Phycisphaerales bacterium]